VHFQSLGGELGTDVFKMPIDIFDNPLSERDHVGQIRISLLLLKSRANGGHKRFFHDVPVVTHRADDPFFRYLPIKRLAVFEPAFKTMAIAAFQIVYNHRSPLESVRKRQKMENG
jgi:hypothetical protein